MLRDKSDLFSCFSSLRQDEYNNAPLGSKEEIKNILDSGGFFKDVQQYLQRKFPHKTLRNFKEKCS